MNVLQQSFVAALNGLPLTLLVWLGGAALGLVLGLLVACGRHLGPRPLGWLLAVLVEEGRPASEACRVFKALPQLLRSVRFQGSSPLRDPGVRAAIADAEATLAPGGRLLMRESGTEPVVRVMAEGEEEALVHRVVSGLCDRIAAVATVRVA